MKFFENNVWTTPEEKTFKQEVVDFFKDLVIIIAIVKFVTIFLVSVFIINGQSMYASYYDKEFILVDRFSALNIPNIKVWEIKRWDVVVFKPNVDKTKEFFIKRIIWTPWDTVKIEEGFVYLQKAWTSDFVKLDEKYLDEENYWKTSHPWVYKIPEWEYFLMWDNRNHSSDSRTCFSYSCSASSRDNFIERKYIIWKVLIDFGYFNFSNFSFSHPEIIENWQSLSTKPKFFSSPSSFNYWL